MVKLINLIIVSRSKKCLEVHKNPTLVHFKECKLVLGLIVSMSHLVMGICFHRHHFLLVNYTLLVISLYFCICLYPNIIFFQKFLYFVFLAHFRYTHCNIRVIRFGFSLSLEKKTVCHSQKSFYPRRISGLLCTFHTIISCIIYTFATFVTLE